jgi:hypothetical protein
MLPVTIAPPQSDAGLTLFPLIAAEPATAEPATADYDLLPDALDAGTLVITEVSEAGSVPELLATNHGLRDVLLLDGMQLIGAKQNRTVGRTLLLAAGTVTRIPVSCMEQGRWRFAAPAMKSGLDHSPAKVRRRTRVVEASGAPHPQDDIARHLADLLARRPAPGGGPTPPAGPTPAELLARAQGEVWDAVRESSVRFDAPSPTGALDDVYQAVRPRLEDLAARFPALPGQVGFVAFLGGDPVGAEILDSPAAYAGLHDRLVRGYLFEALELGTTTNGATPDRAHAFLDDIATVERRPLPTVGRGEYRALVRGAAGDATGDATGAATGTAAGALAGALVGGELEVDGRVVHLSAFPG